MKSLLILLVLLIPKNLHASALSLRFGPPALGNGGPNPLSLPPAVTDLQLNYLSTSLTLYSASITGLWVGKMERASWGGAVTLGAGLAISSFGAGPAIFTAFSYDFLCGWVCGSVDYTQALGISAGHVLSPYALRLGIIRWF